MFKNKSQYRIPTALNISITITAIFTLAICASKYGLIGAFLAGGAFMITDLLMRRSSPTTYFRSMLFIALTTSIFPFFGIEAGSLTVITLLFSTALTVGIRNLSSQPLLNDNLFVFSIIAFLTALTIELSSPLYVEDLHSILSTYAENIDISKENIQAYHALTTLWASLILLLELTNKVAEILGGKYTK
ncbi:hypothetical protein QTV49_004612 [Vibrio vulnificus]|nr:hypothetical protein [Vibrio vulnificus]